MLFVYGIALGIVDVQKYLHHMMLAMICGAKEGIRLTIAEDEARQGQVAPEEVQAGRDDLDPSPW